VADRGSTTANSNTADFRITFDSMVYATIWVNGNGQKLVLLKRLRIDPPCKPEGVGQNPASAKTYHSGF